MALLAIGSENRIANAMNADEVVILDGCPMLCAKKIAGAQGIPAGQHLVMTELGIIIGPSKSYTEDDVEKIVAACRKGEGRKKADVTPRKKSWRKRQWVRLRVRWHQLSFSQINRRLKRNRRKQPPDMG